MSLVLHVDADRWRAHLQEHADALPGLVPVVKGNGYGFGLDRLGHEAGKVGASTVAVASAREAVEVAPAFDGDLLVLEPWRPPLAESATASLDHRVVRTVAHLTALEALRGSDARVVVEGLTSVRRHGIPAEDVGRVRRLLDGVRLEGLALHLPLTRGGSHVPEVLSWVERWRGAGLPLETLWLSHVTAAELAELRRRCPGVTLRSRVGTALWLGDRGAFRPAATVLDAHPLLGGERFGYRQRRARRTATLLVVSGGTAHGVGLEAPKAAGAAARAKGLAKAGLGAAGRARSPFAVAGRACWYAEPPHMHVSMLLLPADVPPPAIGDEVAVKVRMTTTTFDEVRGL